MAAKNGLVAVTVFVAFACSSAAPGPSNAPSPAPSLSPSPSASPAAAATASETPTPRATPTPTEDPLAGRVEAEIRLTGGPDFPIAAFDALWLLTPDADEASITRLDPETNEVVATVPTGTRLCQAMGATDEAIWACTRGGVIRVDPETNEVVAMIEFPTAEFFGYLPFGDESLWALSGEVTRMDELVRIDPEQNSVIATYPLELDAEWISYGEDAVWLTDTADGKLWRFDPATESLTEHATDLDDPGASAVGAGSVWLALHASQDSRPNPDDTTVLRIDPVSGDVEATFATGGSQFESMLLATEDEVLVRAGTPFLSRIDPETNEIVEALDANRSTGSVALGYGSIWATSIELGRVWRLTP